MMTGSERLVVADEAPASAAALARFEQVRALVTAFDLPAEPPVYDLLWRYVRDEHHELSLAVDRAIAENNFNLPALMAIRFKHVDSITTGEVA